MRLPVDLLKQAVAVRSWQCPTRSRPPVRCPNHRSGHHRNQQAHSANGHCNQRSFPPQVRYDRSGAW
jgi:hypothetical protein